MKDCKNCSAQNTDEAAYCQNCGYKFEVYTPYIDQNSNNYSTGYVPSVHTGMDYSWTARERGQPIRDNRAIMAFFECGASVLFLIAAIASTAAVVANLFSNIINIPVNYSGYDGLVTSGIRSGYAAAFESMVFDRAGSVIDFIGMVPSVLMCIGIWFVYVGSRRRVTALPIRGLAIIKGVTIFNICIISLGILSILITLPDILYNSGPYYSFGTDIMYIMTLFVWVLVLALVGFLVAFYVKLLTTIKGFQHTLKTGYLLRKVSMFLIVVNFISAGIVLLVLLLQPFAYSLDEYGFTFSNNLLMFSGWLSMLINVTFSVTIAVCMLNYRSKLKLMRIGDYNSSYQYYQYQGEPDTQNRQYHKIETIVEDSAPANISADEIVEAETEDETFADREE